MFCRVTCSLVAILFAFSFVQINGSPLKSVDDERIVGGEETTIERFPHQISLRRNGRHSCGGSVYKLSVVITAAHCIPVAGLNGLTVVAGTSYRSEVGLEREVARAIVHPGYDSDPTRNDVAILILARPLYFSKLIQPITLANRGESVRSGTKAIVSGWGTLTSGGEVPDQLQYVGVHIITNEECTQKYGEGLIEDSMICAGEDGGGKDSCQGDSGGPLIVGNVLVGIVSWGYGCALAEYPGVYARVSYLRDWIDQEIANAGY